MASGSLRWRHGTGCPRSSAPFEPFALRHHILKRNDVLRRMWPREEGDSTGCQGVGPRNGYGMWVITSTEERWRDLVSAEWGNTRSDKEAVSTSVEEFRDTPCAIDVWLC
jgi:hypothetical protein